MQADIPIIENITFINPTVIPWNWIGGGLVACVLSVFVLAQVFRLLWKRKQVHAEMTAPEQKALQTLDAVFANWRATGHVVYLSAVTTALRVYLEDRFGWNAPTQTTTQIAETVRSIPLLTSAQADRLRTIFIRCDKIKFGSAATRELELDELYQEACGFVKSTAWRRK